MGIKFDDDVLVILTTAPAGLGHIRVTEALRQGLSPKTRTAVVGVSDPGMQWIHRLTSRNRLLKGVMEFTQENRLAEGWFSRNYRLWLRNHPDGAVQAISEEVSMAYPQPSTVIVVATHFGLAHAIAGVREQLMKRLGVRMVLAVIVTDDSPQEMWAVGGVDVIFVPSNTTREKLLSHLLKISPNTPEVVTVPYPVSVELNEMLSEAEYRERTRQLAGKNLRLMVPVSGAAVQLSYYQELLATVLDESIKATVVSRSSPYTADFLTWCQQQTAITLQMPVQDARVVAAYEHEYNTEVIGAEVTKPSEQAFKALYTPRQRGGSVLLLAPPVGRQEKDNLAFLRRHRLIPSVDDQARLNEWCLRGNKLHITPQLLERAHHWRGLMLPDSGTLAGIAIKRLLEANVLKAMGEFTGFLEGHDEISSDGVKEIWEYLGRVIEK